MEHLIHHSASVGSLTKKIIAINPELSTQEIISLVRRSILTQAESPMAGEFVQAEVIDENLAIRLARETLVSKQVL